MSTRAVRTLARQWASELSVPYVDTINLEVNPEFDIWFTIEFSAYGMDKLSFCDSWQEVGSIQLDFLGLAGVGDDALLAAAEPAVRAFFQKRDPTGLLVFSGISAPDDFTPTGGTPKFGVSFVISYSYQIEGANYGR